MVAALAIAGLVLTPVYAASPTWGWGGFTATNFTTSTVVGMKTSDLPYWSNPVAWGGPDDGVAVILSIVTPYSAGFNGNGNVAWQVGLLARHNTKYMDTIYEDPGSTSLTDVCSMCLDGTTTHTYEISRVTNGWTSYVDGSSVQTTTGSALTNDHVDLSYNQMPITMEVATGVSQSNIDGNFEVSEGVSFYYEVSPVGSGSWNSVPHMFAYYYNTGSCTDLQVGNTASPSWTATYSASAYGTNNVETGTTTYLPSPPACGSTFW